MTNEFERLGIPTILISNLESIAKNMNVFRFQRGVAIPHLLGNPSLKIAEEKEMRKNIIKEALIQLLNKKG